MLYLIAEDYDSHDWIECFISHASFSLAFFLRLCSCLHAHVVFFLLLFLLFVERRRNSDTPLLHMFAFASVVVDVVTY